MNRCPITCEDCGDAPYSPAGLRLLSPKLTQLDPFPYSKEAQRQEAFLRAGKMSIQGLQPKLSVILDARGGGFVVVDHGGRYIIKPQHEHFPQLPENEAVTMSMAKRAGLEVPLHGLVRCQDGSMSYFIRRFDRTGRAGKLAVEDFAQLSGADRETKYNSSMEQVAAVVDRYCTFPVVEKVRLLKICLFNFLTGNEDMHLKNFSLITREGKVELAPAYDFLSTTVAFLAIGKKIQDIEEVALPLNGKKRKLSRSIWLDYFARERLGLNVRTIDECLNDLQGAMPEWRLLLDRCFLSAEQKKTYGEIVGSRSRVLGMD